MDRPVRPHRRSTSRPGDVELVTAALLMGLVVMVTAFVVPLIAP